MALIKISDGIIFKIIKTFWLAFLSFLFDRLSLGWAIPFFSLDPNQDPTDPTQPDPYHRNDNAKLIRL